MPSPRLSSACRARDAATRHCCSSRRRAYPCCFATWVMKTSTFGHRIGTISLSWPARLSHKTTSTRRQLFASPRTCPRGPSFNPTSWLRFLRGTLNVLANASSACSECDTVCSPCTGCTRIEVISKEAPSSCSRAAVDPKEKPKLRTEKANAADFGFGFG
eukprot:2633044-Prymnesium_polylepis.1